MHGRPSQKRTQALMYTIFSAVSSHDMCSPRSSAEMVLTASHGVRTVENLRIHCGITDPEELEVGTATPFNLYYSAN